jgi:hypothetical protein
MKRLLFVLLITLTNFLSYAQAIRQQKKTLPDGSKLVYQTINGEMNGLYTIENDDFTLLRGNYVNNKRVGNWYIFNKDNTLYARFNYDVNKTVFIESKSLVLAVINIKVEDELIRNNASVCFPLISLEQYYPIMARIAEYTIPKKDIDNLSGLPVSIIALVDENGNASYKINYEIKGKFNSYDLLVDNEPFKIDWVPAKYEGKNYPSEFSIKIKLNLVEENNNHKRFNWN